ncbi:hypothetical protein EIJ57_23985, partial [Xanthomonas perforans]
MTCLAAAVSACLLLAAPGWAQSPTDATAAAQSAAAVPALGGATEEVTVAGGGFVGWRVVRSHGGAGVRGRRVVRGAGGVCLA